MLNKDFPRYLPYVEAAADIKAYKAEATVEAVVTIPVAHFNEGRQWGLEGETVTLTEVDAKVLERAGQVEVVSKRDPKAAK